MKIEYLPNLGFSFNSKNIEWGNDRDSVRKKLGNKYKVDDRIIDLSDIYDGDESKNINQKRDLYSFGIFKKGKMVLNYDENNKINEIEIHSGIDISINSINLKFGINISNFINEFKKNKIEFLETEKGNYLFPKLKMVIANSESLGGNGNSLDYFYASSDISHLTE